MAALAGCVSYAHLYAPDGTFADEDVVARVGEELYRDRCTLCHSVYEPTAYPMATWDAQLQKFGARAGMTREQRRIVRLYLSTHAPDGERRLRLAAGADRPVGDP